MDNDRASRIPTNPADNLARMKSIVARQVRKLEAARAELDRTKKAEQARTDELEAEKAKGEEADGQKIRGLEALIRKHRFDRRLFGDDIKELKGKIRWAEERQIPFLESELVLEQETLTHKPFEGLMGE